MEFINSFWKYLIISAPYLIMGLLIAGFINTFISVDKLKKVLGGNSMWTVVKAALLGIPLPLCSCSVIPTAAQLKKSGVNNGATSSFLISTPESGVDSIAVTYALMDPFMTVIRPGAAFLSALTAGALQLTFNKDGGEEIEEVKSCCKKKKLNADQEQSFLSRVKSMVEYAFNNLLDDMVLWLLFGIVVGSIVDVFVPTNFFETMGLTGQKFLILAVGIPLYICASATTPIAASLVLKGMSPGTALLILLVGPATNLSNIMVMQKYIGVKGIVINIISIALVALGMSYLTDFLYNYFNWQISFNLSGHEHNHDHYSIIQQLFAGTFAILLLRGIFRTKVKPVLTKSLS
jgi:uncharacterized membrane protein YraQ (UPF0718 family)